VYASPPQLIRTAENGMEGILVISLSGILTGIGMVGIVTGGFIGAILVGTSSGNFGKVGDWMGILFVFRITIIITMNIPY
jgi:hypothetical protein